MRAENAVRSSVFPGLPAGRGDFPVLSPRCAAAAVTVVAADGLSDGGEHLGGERDRL